MPCTKGGSLWHTVTGSGWGDRLLSMFILLGYETTGCPEGFSVFLRECLDNIYTYIYSCYMLLPSNMWISTVESYRSYRSQNVPTSGCFGVVWCMSGHQVVFLGILIPLFSLQYIPMMTPGCSVGGKQNWVRPFSSDVGEIDCESFWITQPETMIPAWYDNYL